MKQYIAGAVLSIMLSSGLNHVVCDEIANSLNRDVIEENQTEGSEIVLYDEWNYVQFDYNETAQEIEITNIKSPGVGSMGIPEMIHGKPVKRIHIEYDLTELFRGVNSGFLTLEIPDSVVEIGEGSFNSLRINSYRAGENSTYGVIDGVLFRKEDKALISYPTTNTNETYRIPDGIKRIEGKAFFNCNRGLKSVEIPSSVEYISSSAFAGTNFEIILSPDNENFSLIDNVLYDIKENQVLHYPSDEHFSRYDGDIWGDSYDLPDETKNIGSWAFFNCEELENITMPYEIETIGEYAFARSQINSMGFSRSIREIGEAAFYNCPLKDGIYFDPEISELYKIEDYAFAHCGFEELILPNCVQEIGKGSFQSTYLKSVQFPENLQIIGDSAFEHSSGFQIDFPDTITYIGNNAFAYGTVEFERNNDTHIFLPANLEWIGDYAFLNYSNVSKVIIPNNVTHIGTRAFKSIAEATIPPSVTYIGYEAFGEGAGRIFHVEKGSYAEQWAIENGHQVDYVDFTPSSGTVEWLQ